ncbi:MAG TPA: sulfatase-like hydrolase/transferase [Terriglobia bacterium]|nr:sulfatase-like hydrolase/transferase [Terriglobia bacterium]
MAESDAQMNDTKPRPTASIGRCTALGVLLGLLIGALEGMCRYRYPDPRIFLTPSVSYVILFLGPLLDGLAAGFFGLLTGLFIASRSRIGRLASLIGGVCLVAGLVFAIREDLRDVAVMVLKGRVPFRFLLAGGAGMLLVGAGVYIGGRLLPLRTLSALLAGVYVLLLAGVGVYALRPPMHRTEVAAKPAGPVAAPNIILITLDTLRADHLSLYGYPRPTTPKLDQWARQGVVFENAIASSSWTLPSHASIFTGLLPHQHGADWAKPLDPSWWTLAEVLSLRGYESAGFTANLGNGWMGLGMGNGFELYDDDSTSVRHNLKSLLLGNRLLQPFYEKYVLPDTFDRRDAGQINRDVLRWFHHRSPQPYYLFINYFDVHEPYLAPAYFPSRLGQVSPWVVGRIESLMDRENNQLSLPAEDTESLMTGYDNCLAFLDDSVGELLDSLSRLPGWENTIVIITSDHGEGFGEHGTYSHASNLHREVLRVPLMIFGPKIPARLRISHLVRIQELFETILQLAGMDNPPFERASLERFWRPGFEPEDFDEFVVSELSLGMPSPSPISLTTPEWQYLRDSQGNEELYRWVSDPTEKFNLAKSPESQKVLRDLQTKLRATIDESLRPWTGTEYLTALGKSDRALASAAQLTPHLDSSSAHPPGIPIGTSQAFFPRRALTLSQRPPTPEEELLRSLPYH